MVDMALRYTRIRDLQFKNSDQLHSSMLTAHSGVLKQSWSCKEVDIVVQIALMQGCAYSGQD